MTSPSLTDLFHPSYGEYSIPAADLQIPSQFDVYAPVNQEDHQCVAVISPNPSKGAKKWTQFGRWITIGIYRDEGRPSSVRPLVMGAEWTRVGKFITMKHITPHQLTVGKKLKIYNVNVPVGDAVVTSVVDSMTFVAIGFNYGPLSGTNAAYQVDEIVNFYEDYRVFRLLPSFKLVPYSTIADIMSASEPSKLPAQRTMLNITTGQEVITPRGQSRSVNYNLPTRTSIAAERVSLSRRFDQVYDETGIPLKIQYQEQGLPKPIYNVDSKHKNQHTLLNQLPTLPLESRVYAFDFYGFDVNDPTRGPNYSSDVVTRDPDITDNLNNIKIKEGSDRTPLFNGKVFDEFGNLAIGIRENLALITRTQILPIELDRFNRPVGKSL